MADTPTVDGAIDGVPEWMIKETLDRAVQQLRPQHAGASMQEDAKVPPQLLGMPSTAALGAPAARDDSAIAKVAKLVDSVHDDTLRYMVRLSRRTFLDLLQRMEADNVPVGRTLTATIPAKAQMFLALWSLAMGESALHMSSRFSLPLSVVHGCIHRTIEWLVAEYGVVGMGPAIPIVEYGVEERYMREVTGDHTYTGLFACLDTLYVPVDSLQHAPTKHSTLGVQVLIGGSGRIIHLYVDGRGEVSPKELFDENPLRFAWTRTVPDAKLIIGSSSLPLLSWCMHEFTAMELPELMGHDPSAVKDDAVIAWNNHVLKAQQHWHTVIRLLKQHWRVFDAVADLQAPQKALFLNASCALFNMQVAMRDLTPPSLLPPIGPTLPILPPCLLNDSLGVATRAALAMAVASHLRKVPPPGNYIMQDPSERSRATGGP